MGLKQLERPKRSFHRLEDEEVLRLVGQGDTRALDFLIQKYKNLVWAKTQTYFLIGGDREDIFQEGLIGLYRAICDYDSAKSPLFRGFAELCITRQIITAIKAATRQKHGPLNSYISLDKPIFEEGSEQTLIDTIAESNALDPQAILLDQERYIYIEVRLSELLSRLERKVLNLYMEGYTYQEISEELKRHVKSIDNALQRIKRKLENLLESTEVPI